MIHRERNSLEAISCVIFCETRTTHWDWLIHLTMQIVVHTTVFLFSIKAFHYLDHYQGKIVPYDKLTKTHIYLLKSVELCIYTLSFMPT